MRKIALTVLAATMAATAADATVYNVTYSGSIAYTSLSSSSGSPPTLNPTAAFSVGDAFTASITFDTANTSPSGLFDADPSVNIYQLSQPVMISFTAGSYSWNETVPGGRVGVQLWNDRDTSAGFTGSLADGLKHVDAQSVSYSRNAFADPANPNYPVDMGAGRKLDSLNLYAFDYTGLARSSDLIGEIAPLSAFSSKSLEYSIYNADTGGLFFANANLASATITNLSPAPEPSTWAMMVIGFGAVGTGMRRRQKISVTFA